MDSLPAELRTYISIYKQLTLEQQNRGAHPLCSWTSEYSLELALYIWGSSDWQFLCICDPYPESTNCWTRVVVKSITIEGNPHVSEPAHFKSVLLAQGKSYMAQHYLAIFKNMHCIYLYIYMYFWVNPCMWRVELGPGRRHGAIACCSTWPIKCLIEATWESESGKEFHIPPLTVFYTTFIFCNTTFNSLNVFTMHIIVFIIKWRRVIMCYLLLRLCPFPQFPLLQKDHFLSPAIVLWVRRKVAPVQPRILLSSECVASAFYVHWIHITRSTVSRHVLLGLSFLPGGWEHYQGWCDSSNFLQRLLGVYHTVAKKEENMAVLSCPAA